MDAEIDLAAEHEALIQFLYIAPVGLAQISPDGSIGMINPISAQLLMPLSRDGSLTNLLGCLSKLLLTCRTSRCALRRHTAWCAMRCEFLCTAGDLLPRKCCR